MAGGFQNEDEAISGINVTPLVDVVLVLLIIFLITAPVLYQSAIKVKLPQAKSGEEVQKSPLEFAISKEGELSIITGKTPEKIDWATLGPRLATLGGNVSEQTAVISADEMTPHGIVVRLMDALRQAGITRFALNVESATAPKR
jgi:biopolymer transport protein ExbD